MTSLDPMSPRDYAAFTAQAIPAYAEDRVASGEWAREEALELSRKSFEALLPRGLATPNHRLYTLRDAQGRSVGALWIAVRERGGARIAYVYDVSVKPEHRRKGHAARALGQLDGVARSLGLSGIGLHVFGHNAGARALYARLGFRPASIVMFKPLGHLGA